MVGLKYIFIFLFLSISTFEQILAQNPKTIGEIVLPTGFNRIKVEKNSFADYLRGLPLKQDNKLVYLYNGTLKQNQNAQYEVVAIDVGNKDLQQCADAIMRLRAEYLFKIGKAYTISFHFTNGFPVGFNKWSQGYRIGFDNKKTIWKKTAKPDSSYQNLRKYLVTIYTYAGTKSLENELNIVENQQNMTIGDIFIKGGFPGHAVIVVDMAANAKNEKIFMLAQSYMPAQEIHILKNPQSEVNTPWYPIDFGDELQTPEWIFNKNSLKRF